MYIIYTISLYTGDVMVFCVLRNNNIACIDNKMDLLHGTWIMGDMRFHLVLDMDKGDGFIIMAGH